MIGPCLFDVYPDPKMLFLKLVIPAASTIQTEIRVSKFISKKPWPSPRELKSYQEIPY